jgi:hypothetical protein
VRNRIAGFRQHEKGSGKESNSAEEREGDGNQRCVEAERFLRHKGEECRDHEGNTAKEIRERDPPRKTLRFPRPIGVAGFAKGLREINGQSPCFSIATSQRCFRLGSIGRSLSGATDGDCQQRCEC